MGGATSPGGAPLVSILGGSPQAGLTYGLPYALSCARLAKDLQIPEFSLHEQYRMHPKIREFVSAAFYADVEPPLSEPDYLQAARPRPQPPK